MERSYSRLLQVALLKNRSQRAVLLRLSGMKLEQVCTLSERLDEIVRAAISAYEHGDRDAVPAQTHCGPKKETGSVPDKAEQQTIRERIHTHFLDEIGLPFAFWKRAAVTALIERQYGLCLPCKPMPDQ